MMFPPDYLTSREQFREAAKRLGWSLHSQPIPCTGPGGEDLSIDAAISPNHNADRVLVVSSGLHGVEAPFGAAVQLAAMADWNNDIGPPAGVRCVFIHALNPYGFAWSRRFDADNIDPNRNFLLPGEAYSGSPNGYKDFDSLLNPKRPPSNWDLFPLRASWLLMRYGLPALKQALVVGQYEYPQGIFFGGHRPCATHVALRQCLPRWVGRARRVVHLDFHTGLGRYGSYKLLLDSPPEDGWPDRLDRWFGRGTYEEDNPNGVAYLPRGSFGPWCIAQRLADEYLYMVAEFGTYSSVWVMGGVRAENQAHHWGRPDGTNEKQAKARLKEVFCPADPAWRQRVLAQGLQLVRRASTGLTEPIGQTASVHRERAA
jgi:hypothetical protein